jgi:nucleoside-diphosphate-sugar epimerase
MAHHRILITGGLGYVGSRLTPHLLAAGHEVRVLDLLLYTASGLEALEADPQFSSWQNRFELFRGDIRDPAVVKRAVAGMDTVIHLAAISNDPTGELDEVLTRQVNFDAVGLLLACARAAGIQRFINASSSSVFGVRDAADIDESLEPEPITCYSKYKMLSEWLVTASAAPDLCAVNIRPATICGYSPRQRFDLTVNKLTADAVRKGVITVHGGEQRRPNVGMTDVINLYRLLLDAPSETINGRTFNFGFENLKVIEIARLIQACLRDLDVKIEVTDTLDQRDYHISSAKLLRELGYQPVSSIREEVANLHQVLDRGAFPDIDAPEHYNLKCMRLDRNPMAYAFASR